MKSLSLIFSITGVISFLIGVTQTCTPNSFTGICISGLGEIALGVFLLFLSLLLLVLTTFPNKPKKNTNFTKNPI
jgi:uncharacterized membrane protein